MGIQTKPDTDAGKNFDRSRHPAGLHSAVCIDVLDKGLKETKFGVKERIAIMWQTGVDHPDFDGRFRISKFYNMSNHSKSTLAKDIKAWTGQDVSGQLFSVDDLAEGLVGKPAMLNIVHNGDWDNVDAVLPLPDGQEPVVPDGTYDRPHRESEKQAVSMPSTEEVFGMVEPDDELPF